MDNLVQTTWSALKTNMEAKKLAFRLQWIIEDNNYRVFFFDDPMNLTATIKITTPKNSDQFDFEKNYKDSSNLVLNAFDADHNRIVSPNYNRADISGAIEVAVQKSEFSSSAIVTHDLTDKTTWYQQSQESTGEVLTLVSDLTYTSANTHWIDVTHGKIYDEDTLNADGEYTVKIYDDGVILNESEYSVDYKLGKITLEQTPNGQITADYRYAHGSTWVLKPTPGKVVQIEHAEIQFSKNIQMTTPVCFEIWVYNPYDLPNKLLYRKTSYKNVKDLIAAGNLGQGFIPAVDTLQHDVIVFPFLYVSVISLESSKGAELRIHTEGDVEYPGEWGVGTFYIISRNE